MLGVAVGGARALDSLPAGVRSRLRRVRKALRRS